jgi:hypothetical protein
MKKKLHGLQSASELYRLSFRRLSAKLLPTFADRACYLVSTTDSHGCILGFLERSCYYFFQVAPQLYSQGWVNPIPDLLLLRKSGSAGNRTRASEELWPLDHRGGLRSAVCQKMGVCCTPPKHILTSHSSVLPIQGVSASHTTAICITRATSLTTTLDGGCLLSP